MKIVSWNIWHGGGSRVSRVLTAIQGHAPDVLVVTEYRAGRSGQKLQAGLLTQGLIHQAACPGLPPKRNSVLVASRLPFDVIAHPALPACEAHRLVHARFEGVDIVAVYFALGRQKKPLFEYLVGLDVSQLAPASLLIGDFNTGKHHVDEGGATFVVPHYLDELERLGWIEAWRRHNGDRRAFSWFSSAGNGFRIDHAYATPGLLPRVVDARYSQAERALGISDHAVMVVELAEGAAYDVGPHGPTSGRTPP